MKPSEQAWHSIAAYFAWSVHELLGKEHKPGLFLPPQHGISPLNTICNKTVWVLHARIKLFYINKPMSFSHWLWLIATSHIILWNLPKWKTCLIWGSLGCLRQFSSYRSLVLPFSNTEKWEVIIPCPIRHITQFTQSMIVKWDLFSLGHWHWCSSNPIF